MGGNSRQNGAQNAVTDRIILTGGPDHRRKGGDAPWDGRRGAKSDHGLFGMNRLEIELWLNIRYR